MLHTVQQIHYTQYNKYTTHNTTNTLHTVQQIHYTQYNRYTTHSSCQKKSVDITASVTSHWSPFVGCFTYNKPKFKFLHISYSTEQYKQKMYYFARTKYDGT